VDIEDAQLGEKHELPEDGQELRPKHVGAITKYKEYQQ
jgi:hypothetical protein